MEFILKWRRLGSPFWKRWKVRGTRYDQTTDRLTVYFSDGSLQEIPKWSGCYSKLGTDWVLATQKEMEKTARQPIPLQVGT